MTNKLRDAIKQIMAGYDLTETDILTLIAAGADETRKRALINSDGATERKMRFVCDHALDWIEFMEGGVTANEFILCCDT